MRTTITSKELTSFALTVDLPSALPQFILWCCLGVDQPTSLGGSERAEGRGMP